jgi:hypothetical protein
MDVQCTTYLQVIRYYKAEYSFQPVSTYSSFKQIEKKVALNWNETRSDGIAHVNFEQFNIEIIK